MLTMDDRFCSSVDFSDCDDESGGPSIDFEELWDILRENPGASSQNTPEGLLTEHVPSCESVPDVASQQSFPIQTGLQELKVEPSPGEISGSVAFFSLCTSEASMSRAQCSDESLQPSRNFMVSDHGNSKLPSQIGSPLASYSGSCKELVHVGPVHDTWCFDGGETFSHVPYSSRNVGREAQYEIPSDNTMFSPFAGDANQVPDYTDNFGLDYFNSEVKTSNVDCGNPFFSENSMGFSGASENYSCTSMEISLINANISSQHAAHAQSSISQVSDGMCRAGNQYSEMPCCVGDNDNHLVDPLRQFPCNRVSVQFIPNRGYINTKDEKEEYLTDRASMQVERASSSVSDLSGIVYSDAKGFSSNCDRSNDTQPSCGNSLLHADSELIDEMVIAKPWVHPQSRIPIKKPKACIKEERSEVAHENVICHSADASNCDVTKKFHPVSDDGLIPEKGLKMLVAGIRPSISTAKRVVTTKVEKVDAFVASKQNCPSQDLLDETPGITLSNGDLNRSAAGHVVQISEPSHVCKQYDFTRDEKEGEAKHPKNMASHLSKVSPESTQSNSLDNRSLLADDENDICILEEISQPPRSLTMTYRKCLAPPQRSTYNDPVHHMGVGGMRLRAGDEQLILQGALQDLSQPKSETSPPDGALAVPLLRHQRIALSWMVNKEIAGWNCVGGILADDQGLGKTISTIALILKERPPSSRVCQKDMKQGGPEALNLDEDHDEIRDFDVMKQDVGSSQLISIGNPVKSGNALLQSKGRPSAGTLVVCPTSVLRQWADELQNKVTSKTRLSVLVYHGSNRTKDPCELAKFDVVLTTYSIVSMEVPKQPLVDKDEDEKGNPEAGVSSIGMYSSKKRKYPPSSNKRGLKSGKAGDDTFVEPIVRPLAKVQWFRVVLDEAQSIKNYRTQVARACWGLRAKRRWCLSGTPIQNAVDDLYSYFRFLKYDPYAAYKTFCEKIKVPINKNPTKGYKKLQAVLKTIMLRRTKGTRLDGEPIITLPPKSIELRKVDFSIEERDFYTRLEADSRAQFEEYAAAGTVKQNYVNILLMLLRLRQACDHRLLVKGYDSYSVWKSSSESVRKLPRERQNCLLRCLEASLAICGICNDPPEDAVVSICGHVFCNQCICEHLAGDDNHCPASNCKVQLNVSSVFSKATLNSSLSDESILNTIPDFSGSEHAEPLEPLFPCSESCSFDSSKIKAALEVLESLSKPRDSRVQCDTLKTSDCEILCDPQSDELLEDMPTNKRNLVANKASEVGEKAIVFSQWTRMLDLLEACLKNSSIQYRRLDGMMTVAARDKAVKDFNTSPEVSVMIMSLKAASLGLNMVAACHVLLMDLWWNPTTEDQAIDRAHRIGQTRPVTVVRLTVKDTVEDRILALQQKKREMVASAFGEDETGSQQSRLTVEDLKYLFMV